MTHTQKSIERSAKANARKSGYTVTLYGETFWHSTLAGAQARARRQSYCPCPIITDQATGETCPNS